MVAYPSIYAYNGAYRYMHTLEGEFEKGICRSMRTEGDIIDRYTRTERGDVLRAYCYMYTLGDIWIATWVSH